MPQILFVCTGNTCRSPMAEYFFSEYKEKYGLEDWSATSAGLHAHPGSGGSGIMCMVMAEEGIEVMGHTPEQVTEELVTEVDLILTMTEEHKAKIGEYIEKAEADDGGSPDVHTLKGFLGKREKNISDPIGENSSGYRRVRDEIRTTINKLLNRLKLEQRKMGGGPED